MPVGREFVKYSIHTAKLSENILAVESQVRKCGDSYVFFWSSYSKDHTEVGVGFAIRTIIVNKLDCLPRSKCEFNEEIWEGLCNYHPWVHTMRNAAEIKIKFCEDVGYTVS